MQLITRYLMIFLFCLAPLIGLGEDKKDAYKGKPLFNQLIFLTSNHTENISEQLATGVRAFAIDTPPSTAFLEGIRTHLKNNKRSFIVILYQGEASHLYDELQQQMLIPFLYNQAPEENFWPCSLELIDNNQRLLVFSEEDFPQFLSMKQFVGSWKYIPNRKKVEYIDNPSTDLALVNYSKTEEKFTADSLINGFNWLTGKMPNFMLVDKQEDLIPEIKKQNRRFRPQAIVLQDGYKVDQVNWLQFPEMRTYGNLFLPYRNDKISPKKNGFRFSPDVVSFTGLTRHILKTFQAIRLELTDGLVAHFPFDKDLKNHAIANAQYQPVLESQVALIDDDEKDNVATFNGHGSYIDCGIPEQNYFKENFTICLWIKPDQLNNNRSILGKGETFSAKIKDGALLFTIPGVKDHSNFKNEIELNKWQHIAYVFNAGQKIQFFKNGQLAFEYSASEMKHTEHALLIGSNLWDEYYSGLMDDLCIWQRGLSPEEIYTIFEYGLKTSEGKENKATNSLIGLALFILVAGGAIVFIRKKKAKPAVTSLKETTSQPTRPITKKQKQDKYNIKLFGGFNIINLKEEDLTSRFSPKRKQLFILILLYSLRDNKGITSKKMTDFLWEGHSAQSAKNNRSTNIQRVREILEEETGLQILYKDKYWQVEIAPEVSCDFSEYIQLKQVIESDDFNIDYLKQYLAIISKGVLLPNMEYEWLDTIQSQVNEEVINTLFTITESHKEKLNADLFIKIAEAILLFDPVNEEATALKIQTLIQQGMNKPAKDIYDHFCRSYRNFYGEEFDKSFKNFIEN
ncbi:hypothetical protein EMN47_05225 [Prolixibacteraceae bacterium JC049]|nr:hypothetical protein [Prolixibacteraceae bacterium JC049]